MFTTVLPWVLVAVMCWFVYQLLRQNGRILFRLEALEERVIQLAAGGGAPAPPQGLDPGSTAPDFQLPDLSGNLLSLARWRGQRILLIFFNPKCGFCEQMADRLAALKADESEGRPIPVVISSGSADENRHFMEQHSIRCPVLVQQKEEVTAAYRVSGTPMGYLIDEVGAIATPLTIGAGDLLALEAVQIPSSPEIPDVEPATHEHSDNRTRGKANRGLATSRLQRDGLKAGTPAPLFRLPRLNGGELSLEEFRGRQVLLVFSDPDCGPCDELAPALEEFHRRDGDDGVRVLMIGRRDPALNRRKCAEQGLTFPVLLQRNWEISLLYAKFATPIAYLIDEHGVLSTDVVIGVEPIRDLLASVARKELFAAAEGNGVAAAGARTT
jgi:peroxiredoxin